MQDHRRRERREREAAALDALGNDDAGELYPDGILGHDDFFKRVDHATAERLGVTVESVGYALMAAGGRSPT